jgi:hypothetical protein
METRPDQMMSQPDQMTKPEKIKSWYDELMRVIDMR